MSQRELKILGMRKKKICSTRKGIFTHFDTTEKCRYQYVIPLEMQFLPVTHRSRNTWNGGVGGGRHIHKFCSRMNFFYFNNLEDHLQLRLQGCNVHLICF